VRTNLLLKTINYVKSILFKKATIIFVSTELSNINTINPQNINITYKFVDQTHISQIASADYLSINQVKTLFNKKAKCLGAFEGDTLVGYVWFQCMPTNYPFFNYTFNFNNNAYIGPDYVSPLYRGKRIHGALLCRMLKYLKKQNYTVAWTSVWSDNIPSIRGLMAVGFEPKFEITAIRILNKLIYRKIRARNSW